MGTFEFDHIQLSRMPEYQGIKVAMQEFVEASWKMSLEIPQDEWKQVLGEIADSLDISDYCAECYKITGEKSHYPNYNWPYGMRDGTAFYRCKEGHQWTCYWSR